MSDGDGLRRGRYPDDGNGFRRNRYTEPPQRTTLYNRPHYVEQSRRHTDPPSTGYINAYEPSPYGPVESYNGRREEFIIYSGPSTIDGNGSVTSSMRPDGESICTHQKKYKFRQGSTCKVLLCVSLVLLFIGVVVAGVVLSVLLSQRILQTKGIKNFESTATMNNVTFIDALSDVNSSEFHQLSKEFCEAIRAMYTTSTSPIKEDFENCQVLEFTSGSVVVKYRIGAKLYSDLHTEKGIPKLLNDLQVHFRNMLAEHGPWSPLQLDRSKIQKFIKVDEQYRLSNMSTKIELSKSTDSSFYSGDYISTSILRSSENSQPYIPFMDKTRSAIQEPLKVSEMFSGSRYSYYSSAKLSPFVSLPSTELYTTDYQKQFDLLETSSSRYQSLLQDMDGSLDIFTQLMPTPLKIVYSTDNNREFGSSFESKNRDQIMQRYQYSEVSLNIKSQMSTPLTDLHITNKKTRFDSVYVSKSSEKTLQYTHGLDKMSPQMSTPPMNFNTSNYHTEFDYMEVSKISDQALQNYTDGLFSIFEQELTSSKEVYTLDYQTKFDSVDVSKSSDKALQLQYTGDLAKVSSQLSTNSLKLYPTSHQTKFNAVLKSIDPKLQLDQYIEDSVKMSTTSTTLYTSSYQLTYDTIEISNISYQALNKQHYTEHVLKTSLIELSMSSTYSYRTEYKSKFDTMETFEKEHLTFQKQQVISPLEVNNTFTFQSNTDKDMLYMSSTMQTLDLTEEPSQANVTDTFSSIVSIPSVEVAISSKISKNNKSFEMTSFIQPSYLVSKKQDSSKIHPLIEMVSHHINQAVVVSPSTLESGTFITPTVQAEHLTFQASHSNANTSFLSQKPLSSTSYHFITSSDLLVQPVSPLTDLTASNVSENADARLEIPSNTSQHSQSSYSKYSQVSSFFTTKSSKNIYLETLIPENDLFLQSRMDKTSSNVFITTKGMSDFMTPHLGMSTQNKSRNVFKETKFPMFSILHSSKDFGGISLFSSDVVYTALTNEHSKDKYKLMKTSFISVTETEDKYDNFQRTFDSDRSFKQDSIIQQGLIENLSELSNVLATKTVLTSNVTSSLNTFHHTYDINTINATQINEIKQNLHVLREEKAKTDFQSTHLLETAYVFEVKQDLNVLQFSKGVDIAKTSNVAFDLQSIRIANLSLDHSDIEPSSSTITLKTDINHTDLSYDINKSLEINSRSTVFISLQENINNDKISYSEDILQNQSVISTSVSSLFNYITKDDKLSISTFNHNETSVINALKSSSAKHNKSFQDMSLQQVVKSTEVKPESVSVLMEYLSSEEPVIFEPLDSQNVHQLGHADVIKPTSEINVVIYSSALFARTKSDQIFIKSQLNKFEQKISKYPLIESTIFDLEVYPSVLTTSYIATTPILYDTATEMSSLSDIII